MMQMQKNWKIFWISINLLLFITSPCFPQDVTYLNKDTPTPYSGYLYSESKAKELRLQLIDLDTFKSLNQSLQKSIELGKINLKLTEDKNEILLKKNDGLAQSLYDARQTSDFVKLLWFCGGVMATILVLYGVKTTTR